MALLHQRGALYWSFRLPQFLGNVLSFISWAYFLRLEEGVMPGYIESCGVPPSRFPVISLHFLLHDNEVREFSTELLGRQAGAFWKENDVIVVFPLGVRDMNPRWLSLFHRMPSKLPEQVSASSPAVSLVGG